MTDGECRHCGVELAAGGYLCDDCDRAIIETADCSAGWREEMRHQGVVPGRDTE
jgi:hypothetical protein